MSTTGKVALTSVLPGEIAIDCVAPAITAVAAHDVGRHEATVTVTTDEPVEVVVSYGLDCGALTQSVSGAGLAAEHQMLLSGLDDSATYYYSVEARDEAGNISIDDDNGQLPRVHDGDDPGFPHGVVRRVRSRRHDADLHARRFCGRLRDLCRAPSGRGCRPTSPTAST